MTYFLEKNRCKVSDIYDGPKFSLITPTPLDISNHISRNTEFCTIKDLEIYKRIYIYLLFSHKA